MKIFLGDAQLDNQPGGIFMICMQSDATNSNIWKRNKLVGTEVIAAGLVDPSVDAFDDAFAIAQRLCDLLPGDDCIGMGLIATLLKQLNSIGCRSWLHDQPDKDNLEGWVITSDRESDQQKARKMISAASAPNARRFVFTSDCFEHAAYLVVKDSLAVIHDLLTENERPRYDASIAKIVNVWRSVAKGVYSSWAEMHGHVEARRVAHTLCPAASVGR